MSQTMLPRETYLAQLRQESTRFAEAISAAPARRRVPTCPDWTRDDLLWHVTKVQWFWARIVRDRITDRAAVAKLALDRPSDPHTLAELGRRATDDLVAALATTPPFVPLWTWTDDRSAGFVLRRQTHEALMHRVDAELIAGARTPLDPNLAADGVDEALRVMFTAPSWGEFVPLDGVVRLRARDTGHTWRATPGRCTGADRGGPDEIDEPLLVIDDAEPAAAVAATVEAAAADLDCLLWSRPALGPVSRSGSPAILSGFDDVIAAGVQ